MDKQKLFKEIFEYSNQVKASYSNRDKIARGIENMYLMHKTDEDKELERMFEGVALTKSTDERVAIKNVVRILSTSTPRFAVPKNQNALPQTTADMLEKGANALLTSSDRANRRPLKYDAVLPATLFDLCIIRTTCTQDYLDALMEQEDDAKSKGVKLTYDEARSLDVQKRRVEQFVNSSPYVFDSIYPLGAYPVWDRYGLKGIRTDTVLNPRDVIASYGRKAKEIIAANGTVDYSKNVTLCMYTDDLYNVVWLKDKQEFILMEEHKMPGMNVVANQIEGSSMFTNVEDQFEPFLYTVYMSGLDQRKTEAMTAMYTNMRMFGLTTTLVFTEGDATDEDPVIEKTNGGLVQYVRVPKGGQWGPMLNKGLVDPATWNGLQLAVEKTEQATIYRQTTGGSSQPGDAYSKTALLSQLGRIPVESIRVLVGRTMADAVGFALKWVKEKKTKVSAYNYEEGALVEIVPADIPEYFNLECRLDLALPVDKLQQANTASLLIQSGVVSEEWVQDEILNIDQPKEMQKAILVEKLAKALIERTVQQILAPPAPPPPPEGANMAPGSPQTGVPPELAMMLQGAQGGGPPPAMPGAPPEMMRAGMGGPEQLPMEGEMMRTTAPPGGD